MTTNTDIVNRALQLIGTRTTVTDAELAGNTSNEAIQANLVLDNIRRRLLRMAPWDCALRTANLTYITSIQGTPENTSPATALWAPGLPTPPWAYEYQYPIDCLRACWIIPSNQTGYAGGIPITTAVTGGAPGFGYGPPVKFKVQNDTFFPVTSATVVNGGTGHALRDIITLPIGPTTSPPIGAPVQLFVSGVTAGVITSVIVISVVPGATLLGGSYFGIQTNPIAQSLTSGAGVGATFNIVQAPAAIQRVILTNQEFATLVFCRDVTDPNVTDDLFQDAFVKILAATMNMALQGDAKITNSLIGMANVSIIEARKVDGNEGLTVNDITPDWIRIRGVTSPDLYGSMSGYDWGDLWGAFG